jgi:CxxC-x17-CxxC domain-containing protein
MFKATCSKCGKECEVPFKPTGSKPVYCRDCFRTIRDSASGNSYSRDSRKPNFDNNRGSSYPQYKEQFEALNTKLDKILKLLNPEKPMEAPEVATKPQVKDEAIKVENVKPVKKKTKAKKIVPTETDIPRKTSKE